jgi:hypothetical protein
MRRLEKALAVGVASVLIVAGAAVLPAEAGNFGGGFHGGGFHGGGFRGGQPFRGGNFRGHRFHHGGFRHFGPGVFIGGALFAPWWWGAPYPYYPYYAYAPPVEVLEPPEYVQAPPVVSQPTAYWYYCESAQGYYPNVPSCPESWIPVPARPQ